MPAVSGCPGDWTGEIAKTDRRERGACFADHGKFVGAGNVCPADCICCEQQCGAMTLRFPGCSKALGRTSHFLRQGQEWLDSFCLLSRPTPCRLPVTLGTWAVRAGSVNINSSLLLRLQSEGSVIRGDGGLLRVG